MELIILRNCFSLTNNAPYKIKIAIGTLMHCIKTWAIAELRNNSPVIKSLFTKLKAYKKSMVVIGPKAIANKKIIELTTTLAHKNKLKLKFFFFFFNL